MTKPVWCSPRPYLTVLDILLVSFAITLGHIRILLTHFILTHWLGPKLRLLRLSDSATHNTGLVKKHLNTNDYLSECQVTKLNIH